jgi:pyruvate,water dikinase
LLLPSFGRNKQDMERMMGLEEPVDFVRDEALGALERVRRAPALMRALVRLQARFATLPRAVERFMAEFEAVVATVDRSGLSQASADELVALEDRLWRDLVERWSVPIINDFFVMMATGKLRRLVTDALGGDGELWLTSLLGGGEGLESAAPTRWLMRLARTAAEQPALARALEHGDPGALLPHLGREHPAFAAELEAFLHRYGDRCMGELKLETISLREDPSFAIQMIRNYLGRADLDPEAVAERERARRVRAERELAARLPRRTRWRMRRALAATRRGVADRERMRLARTRMFGLFRAVYRALGRRLVEVSALAAEADVFYLTRDELRGAVDGTAVALDLGGLVALRKREYGSYAGDDPPHRIESEGVLKSAGAARATRPSDAERSARVLRGLGCSAGVIEARVRIVRDARDARDVDGKVLTALRTDPGWAPLFPSAAAILVERGSTLSHSAVLARELGIPAVVGVPGLLAIVRDGEAVRLDGAAGTVERLEQA